MRSPGLRLADGVPDLRDLYIGNRGHRLIGLVAHPRRRVFWLHNPGRYLRKPRNVWRLALYQPVVVTTGAHHASTVPPWLAYRRAPDHSVRRAARPLPPCRPARPAAAAGDLYLQPLRGLGWLLDLWVKRIWPAVPGAELHVYAGAAVYGQAGNAPMEAVLAQAEGLTEHGVRRHAPVGREALAEVLAGARAMLYRGDWGETFCLALAEAQAMGVPAVVQPLGSVGERVRDGETGRVTASDDEFAAAAIAALADDALWRRWHLAALEHQRGLSWDDAVAARFEALIP